jgi:tyrosyl-tRNA synthetase
MSDILSKAVEETVPADLATEKISSGKKLRVYMGIDPTGTRLHIGHAVPLRKLKQFANEGHEVIFLIGSYTAMFGDPTGRDQMRQPPTKEEVSENFTTYKEQASKVLDFSNITIRYNDEWLDELKGEELLKVLSVFSIQQLMQRDMFKERIKRGEDLSVSEIMYPLMQAYDSVILDVDCEIGGNDQLFNMLCGRKLQKAFGKRDKFVLTVKLLEGTDGRKMSKSYDNCIYLDDAPNDMFGKVMSVKDDLMPQYFELCTDVPEGEYTKLLKGDPREAKARLAKEIVTLYHGSTAADAAVYNFEQVFSKGGVPDDIPETSMKHGETLLDLLCREKMIASKSDGRRLIDQGAISLDEQTVTEIHAPAQQGVVKVGKRKFLRIK